MKIIFCPKCGSKEQGNAFCSKCGNKLINEEPKKELTDSHKLNKKEKKKTLPNWLINVLSGLTVLFMIWLDSNGFEGIVYSVWIIAMIYLFIQYQKHKEENKKEDN